MGSTPALLTVNISHRESFGSLPARLPAAPPAVIELEIAGKVRLRIPLTTPPTLAALIAHQHLTIRKLQRALHGQSSERSARLHDQMELTFEELESTATEDEIAAEQAAARTTEVSPYMRKRPARQPFPEHLPRERVVEPAPTACHCCGGHRLRKLGEDITETLEVVPRQWKVIQHVREKFTCAIARRSARLRRRSTPPRAAGPVPACWR